MLGGLQGRAPERLHVVLGTGATEVLRVADFEAYYRRVRERFLAFVADPPPTPTACRSPIAASAGTTRSARSAGWTTTT